MTRYHKVTYIKSDLLVTCLLAVLNAAIIGLSFLLVKSTLQYAAPLDTLTYRFAAAFVIMILPMASKMSAFANLSTVVSIASGAIFLQETVIWYHLLGSVLIIAGVIGSNVSRKPLQRLSAANHSMR